MYRFRFASDELIFSIVFNYIVKSSIILVYKSQTDTLPLIYHILYTYNRRYSIFNLYGTALLFGMTKYNTIQKVISKNIIITVLLIVF